MENNIDLEYFLKRRRTTLQNWCQEHNIKTLKELVAKKAEFEKNGGIFISDKMFAEILKHFRIEEVQNVEVVLNEELSNLAETATEEENSMQKPPVKKSRKAKKE